MFSPPGAPFPEQAQSSLSFPQGAFAGTAIGATQAPSFSHPPVGPGGIAELSPVTAPRLHHPAPERAESECNPAI